METKIISCVGEKGGVGKTTVNIMLATNLAFGKKKKVVLIDLDNPQYSIVNKRENEYDQYKDQLGKTELYPIVKATVENLRDTIIEYYGHVDIIIIDFPGNMNAEMAKGLFFLEHIFVPFSYDELEIDSALRFYINVLKYYGKNEKAAFQSIHLFFNKYQLIKKSKYAEVRESIVENNYKILDSVIKDKTIYKETYRSTVIPIPKGKEEEEEDFKPFLNEILTKIK